MERNGPRRGPWVGVACEINEFWRKTRITRRQNTTMKRTWSLVIVVALVSVVAIACGQPPQEDVKAAQAEMEKARQAQADKWAPTEFGAADQAMSAAQAEIAAQNEKWMKNYDKAKELLAKSKEEASKAAEAAVANKEQSKKDAEAALAAADSSLQAADASLKTAPVTKDSKADLQLFKNDLSTLHGTLDTARQAFSTEDYKSALDSAGSVKERATAIVDQIAAAKQKKAAKGMRK